MWNFEDIPQKPRFILVPLTCLNDLRDGVPVNIGSEQCAIFAVTFREGCLEDNAVLVPINDIFVLTPSKWAVDEKLYFFISDQRKTRNRLTSIYY